MRILSVIHGDEAKAEIFAPAVEADGHELDEWSFAWGTPPPRPLEEYDAFLVFGGAMHPDQDEKHPWMDLETAWLQRVLAERRPVLGVCLGVQLLARAAGAWVGPLDEAEIGWIDVALTDAGRDDPVLGAMPESFAGLVWHHYTYAVPEGAVELARTDRTTQAFRLGDACWGVQFHPEVTAEQLESWIVDFDDPPPDPDRLRREIPRHIGRWNELGVTLCRAFLAAAEKRVAAAR